MKKYLIKFGLIGSLAFLGVFIYCYKTSGKFRQSIITAWVAVTFALSGPKSVQAKEVDGAEFSPQSQQHHSRIQKNRELLNNAMAEPADSSSSNTGGEGMPKFPETESVETTEKRVKNIEALTREMEEMSESESDSETENECPNPNLQQSQSKYQPNGYSKEQIRTFRQNPRYSELAKDPQLIGQECETNPKSQEEACTILQAEEEGVISGSRRPNLKMGDPNYDYRTASPTKFVESKVPRNDSLKDAARLGRKSHLQRGNDGDITIVVNLMRLRPEKRAAYAKTFLEAAGGYGVIFINN